MGDGGWIEENDFVRMCVAWLDCITYRSAIWKFGDSRLFYHQQDHWSSWTQQCKIYNRKRNKTRGKLTYYTLTRRQTHAMSCYPGFSLSSLSLSLCVCIFVLPNCFHDYLFIFPCRMVKLLYIVQHTVDILKWLIILSPKTHWSESTR